MRYSIYFWLVLLVASLVLLFFIKVTCAPLHTYGLSAKDMFFSLFALSVCMLYKTAKHRRYNHNSFIR